MAARKRRVLDEVEADLDTDRVSRNRLPRLLQRLDRFVDAGHMGDLVGAEVKCLLALLRHADSCTCECFPGRKLLAKETGLHELSVSRALGSLEEKRFIRRKRKAHRAIVRELFPTKGRIGATDTDDDTVAPSSDKVTRRQRKRLRLRSNNDTPQRHKKKATTSEVAEDLSSIGLEEVEEGSLTRIADRIMRACPGLNSRFWVNKQVQQLGITKAERALKIAKYFKKHAKKERIRSPEALVIKALKDPEWARQRLRKIDNHGSVAGAESDWVPEPPIESEEDDFTSWKEMAERLGTPDSDGFY